MIRQIEAWTADGNDRCASIGTQGQVRVRPARRTGVGAITAIASGDPEDIPRANGEDNADATTGDWIRLRLNLPGSLSHGNDAARSVLDSGKIVAPVFDKHALLDGQATVRVGRIAGTRPNIIRSRGAVYLQVS